MAPSTADRGRDGLRLGEPLFGSTSASDGIDRPTQNRPGLETPPGDDPEPRAAPARPAGTVTLALIVRMPFGRACQLTLDLDARVVEPERRAPSRGPSP